MAFLSATFVICERALREVDGVISAIRLVDYFMAPPAEALADIPPDRQAIVLTVVGKIRISHDDSSEHEIVLTLVRPNGEESPNTLVSGQPVPVANFPESPRQVWVIAQVGVAPKQYGEHYFKVIFDGDEVTRVYFTLAQFSSENPILKYHQSPTTAP
jgi:hypothetical protein